MKEYTQYKVLREKAGLSVKQVMEALNVSDAAVYFWETGANAPSTKKLPDIAKLYGCTVDDLLKEAKPSVPKPID